MDKEKHRKKAVRELIYALAFMLWGMVLVFGFFGEFSLLPVTTYQKIIWWTCAAAVVVIILRSNHPFDNPIGAVMCIMFGPLTLLTMLSGWLIVPRIERRRDAKSIQKEDASMGKNRVRLNIMP